MVLNVHTEFMRRSVVVVGVFIILVLIVVKLSGYINKTKSLIWLSDPRGNFAWILAKEDKDWWNNAIGRRNPNVLVYLSPYIIKSEISMGKGDAEPVFYAKWGDKKLGYKILHISINNSELTGISQAERDKQLALFVSQTLMDYWRAPQTDKMWILGELEPRDKQVVGLREQ